MPYSTDTQRRESTPLIGDNGGPRLQMTLAEAQQLDDVQLRPSYVQRYAGAGSPLRAIVGQGGEGCFGTRLLLACGHWREVRDYNIMPAMGRKRPVSVRCGCCRLDYAPRERDLANVAALTAGPAA